MRIRKVPKGGNKNAGKNFATDGPNQNYRSAILKHAGGYSNGR